LAVVHRADGLADDGIGLVTHLAFRNDVVGPQQIKLVDLRLRDELVDVDRARALEGDVVELVLSEIRGMDNLGSAGPGKVGPLCP
jgi:hypothetical protein